jgi:hypothetical protein
MRLPSQEVRSVDNAGRPSETDFKFKKSIQRFMHNAGKLIETAKLVTERIVVGSPTGDDLGDGTINAEEVYDNGSRVLTERAGQTIEAGFDNEPYSIGTITTGTVTIDPINGQHQTLTNNGAFTLSPASVTKYATVSLHIINDASAGAVTFTGWGKKYPSGALTTTDEDEFNIVIYFFGSAGADYAIFARQ